MDNQRQTHKVGTRTYSLVLRTRPGCGEQDPWYVRCDDAEKATTHWDKEATHGKVD